MAEDVPGLVDHLFRREAGKLVAYLTKLFGLKHLNLAEDVVQDTLCQALSTWSAHGYPDNPSAWLMRVARNRALDLMRHDNHFRALADELTQRLAAHDLASNQAVFEREIRDDQLRMMFACCHPALAGEVQVTLILKTLCGFSVAEIASALLSSEDAIEKRLGRARKLFRDGDSFVELTDHSDVSARLEGVIQAVYLLFNEGYHGSHAEETVREELCYEALRLALLLSDHPCAAEPKTFALVALFCFHAARLRGRMDAAGELVQLEEQDRSRWDRGLIARGFAYLARSASGHQLSELHLEAAIASLHSGAPSFRETDWARISELYELLYALKPTPVVALNRAIALAQVKGPELALKELARIPDADKLEHYPFFWAARGEFERRVGRHREAQRSLERALSLARNPAETRFLERKLRN